MNRIKKGMPIVIILLYGSAGLLTALAFTEFMEEESNIQNELTTRFYVINESKEMTSGKPVSYRAIIENQEGTNVNFDLKVLSAGEIVYSQEINLDSNKELNQTISFIPNLTGDYQKLEFLLYKNNQLYRTRVFQISPENYSLNYIAAVDSISLLDNLTRETIRIESNKNYTMQLVDGIIVYVFDTGEKLELKASNEIISKDDALYTTSSKGQNIIFMGKTYEKSVPNSAKFLNPIIMQDFNITLKINESLEMLNGYSVTLISIDEISVIFRISKDNKVLWDIASLYKSPVEYWKQVNDIKKEKMIRIIPREIKPDWIMFDINQYGDNQVININNQFGEFQVIQITEDAIIMKNTQEIILEPGKEIPILNNSFRIKV